MAGSQDEGIELHDPVLPNLFTLREQNPEEWLQRTGTPSTGPLPRPDATPVYFAAGIAPPHVQDHYNETAAATISTSEARFTDNGPEPPMGPTQSVGQATKARQYKPASAANNISNEIQRVNDDIEENYLKLQGIQLRRKRQLLLQQLQPPHQQQLFEPNQEHHSQDNNIPKTIPYPITDRDEMIYDDQDEVFYVSTSIEVYIAMVSNPLLNQSQQCLNPLIITI